MFIRSWSLETKLASLPCSQTYYDRLWSSVVGSWSRRTKTTPQAVGMNIMQQRMMSSPVGPLAHEVTELQVPCVGVVGVQQASLRKSV